MKSFIKRDGQPLLLQQGPAQVRNFRVRPVLQQRIGELVFLRHLLDVPNERLAVVSDGANVEARLRRPGQRVDAVLVVVQLADGVQRLPNVKAEEFTLCRAG